VKTAEFSAGYPKQESFGATERFCALALGDSGWNFAGHPLLKQPNFARRNHPVLLVAQFQTIGMNRTPHRVSTPKWNTIPPSPAFTS
jgi:hypothetical protein